MTEKTRVRVPRGHGHDWWQGLTPEQKKALVYPRLVETESNKSIGDSYGVTPNSIASLRNKWNDAKKPDPYIPVMIDADDVAPKATVTRASSKKRKKPKAKRPTRQKPKAKPAPIQPPPPPPPEPLPAPIEMILTPIEDEPAAEVVSDEEVAASARHEIIAAANEAAPEPTPTPTSTPQTDRPQKLPQRFVAEIVDPTKCRCPVPGGLRHEKLCGASPVVYSGCCESHANILFPQWRNKRQ